MFVSFKRKILVIYIYVSRIVILLIKIHKLINKSYSNKNIDILRVTEIISLFKNHSFIPLISRE
jgi:hypothetical protein